MAGLHAQGYRQRAYTPEDIRKYLVVIKMIPEPWLRSGLRTGLCTGPRGGSVKNQRHEQPSLVSLVRSPKVTADLNVSLPQVYFGIPKEANPPSYRSGVSDAEEIAKASAIRSYPGQVREGLADGSLSKPSGR